MKRVVVFFSLAVVSFCVLAESSSAQILFKRVWQRKKAEIRSEVYGQVYRQVSNELNAKVDADLAEQMDAAKGQLQQATEAQIASETEKLTEQIKAELAKLHEETQKLVAVEAEKLQQEAAKQIAKLREQADNKVAAESKRLDDEVKSMTAKLTEDNKKQIDTAAAAAAAGFAKFKAELSEQVAADVKKQTEGIKDEVMTEIKAARKPKAKGNKQKPGDDGKEPDPAQQAGDSEEAIPPKPVKPVEEDADGENAAP